MFWRKISSIKEPIKTVCERDYIHEVILLQITGICIILDHLDSQ